MWQHLIYQKKKKRKKEKKIHMKNQKRMIKYDNASCWEFKCSCWINQNKYILVFSYQLELEGNISFLEKFILKNCCGKDVLSCGVYSIKILSWTRTKALGKSAEN